MIGALASHLLQSTVFGLAAALLTLGFRNNQARVRYWLWLAASVKFLVPFQVLVLLGGVIPWHRTYVQLPAVFAIEQFTLPYAPIAHAATRSTAPNLIPIILLALWCCGCACVLIVWLARWRRVAAILRSAEPLCSGREAAILRRLDASLRIVSSGAQLEPGVFGVWRPVLFWPAGISERLSDSQIEAILAHEVAHVRRRDNLAAAIHMLVEALFWFHPLVWWIGARLVEERENACDQEVLRLANDAEGYAEGILTICEHCLQAPLLCASGVNGADLKKRIQSIVAHDVGHDLGWPRKLLIAVAGVAAIAVPIGVGVMNAPAIEAQSQPAAASGHRFEVASIKPSARGQQGMYVRPSPSGLSVENMPVKEMMVLAWGIQPFQIAGGPSWTESARYDISAKSEHKSTLAELFLMLQSLLEERFQLRIHHVTRQLPLYELVVANKNGKLGPQLTKSRCIEYDPSRPAPPPAPSERRVLYCDGASTGPGSVRMNGVRIARFTTVLGRILGRTVVDKTGLTGKYDIEARWTPDQAQLMSLYAGAPPGLPAPPPFDPNGPSIFTALQEQLGLKLISQKGPVDILVIDHVERPSEN